MIQFNRILDALGEKLPKVAEHLDAACADVLAFTGFHREFWRQIWSNNLQERIAAGSASAPTWSGIFPPNALIRVVGAVLAEQHDTWRRGRRYLGLDFSPEPVSPPSLTPQRPPRRCPPVTFRRSAPDAQQKMPRQPRSTTPEDSPFLSWPLHLKGRDGQHRSEQAL